MVMSLWKPVTECYSILVNYAPDSCLIIQCSAGGNIMGSCGPFATWFLDDDMGSVWMVLNNIPTSGPALELAQSM